MKHVCFVERKTDHGNLIKGFYFLLYVKYCQLPRDKRCDTSEKYVENLH